MADISQYSIVTYERKPGHWRAAFVRKALTRSAVRDDTVHSSVTPDDFASEAEAQFAAEKIVRKL
jgi:ribose 1,5-bisphosphokinase PhnN